MATKKKSGSKKPRKAPRSAAQKAATRKMLAANKARKSGSKRSKSSKRSAPKGLGARVSRLETRVARHDVQIDALQHRRSPRHRRDLQSAQIDHRWPQPTHARLTSAVRPARRHL